MLKGKTAVVTGGTRGIGYAVVKKYLENGAQVILFGSRKETVEKALQKLKEENPDWPVEGAWPDLENGLCKNGSANVLTADIPSSQLANACAGNSALVYIEKYTGNAPKLTAFDQPAVQA